MKQPAERIRTDNTGFLQRLKIKSKLAFSFSVVAVLLLGMAAAGRIMEPGVKQKPSELDVPFYTIEKGAHSGIKSAERISIKEESDWLTLWRRHKSGSMIPDSPPPVDFDQCMVLAVFQGEDTEDAGFIEIERVRLLSDRMVVTVGETSSGAPKGGSERSTMSSFHIVKAAHTALPVVFQ